MPPIREMFADRLRAMLRNSFIGEHNLRSNIELTTVFLNAETGSAGFPTEHRFMCILLAVVELVAFAFQC